MGLNTSAADPTSFFPDGSYLMLHQDSTHPANLYVLHAGGDLKQITHNESPGLAAAVVPPSQLVTYKSFDGRLISAFAWVPFNLKRDGKAAAVVMPHGGPTGQVVDSFNSRAVLLASRGFVVIAPNVRVSHRLRDGISERQFQRPGRWRSKRRDRWGRFSQGDPALWIPKGSGSGEDRMADS